MASVELSPAFEGVSGRLCKKGKAIIAVNKKTGKSYYVDYHESKQPNSTKQQAAKAKFKQKAQAASSWWAQNKEVKDATTGNITQQATADMKKLLAAYDAQHKYGNPYSYLRSLVQDNGTIAFPWLATSTTPTTPTTNPSDYDPETGV